MTGPIDTITTVVASQSGEWSPIFATAPTSQMQLYFSAGFNADWVAAMQYNNLLPVLDGDPISGYMAVSALSLLNATVDNQTSQVASVSTTIAVTLSEVSSIPVDSTIVFSMVYEASSWKIDDINPNLTSLDVNGAPVLHDSVRAYLQQVVTQAPSYATSFTDNSNSVASYVSPSIVDIPSAIGASGKVYGSGLSADLVQSVVTISLPASWTPGIQVVGNDLTPGTAVAGFVNGGYTGYAGILLQQVFEGNAAGLYLFVQWPGQPAFVKFHPAYGSGVDSADKYYVIAK